MILHGYFRSSASYRVRIALNLKDLPHEHRYLQLRQSEQRSAAYLALNPQGFVPVLEEQGRVLTQSLAICEYLDELCPEPPLLPGDAWQRARIRGFSQVIACDIHPLQNLKILRRLAEIGQDETQVQDWARAAIGDGFDACERLIESLPGPFCFGEAPTLADVCLVPQLANARRFGVELRWPRLLAAESACMALDAFRRAAPEQQADA